LTFFAFLAIALLLAFYLAIGSQCGCSWLRTRAIAFVVEQALPLFAQLAGPLSNLKGNNPFSLATSELQNETAPQAKEQETRLKRLMFQLPAPLNRCPRFATQPAPICLAGPLTASRQITLYADAAPSE
jgi:hypothetical protein